MDKFETLILLGKEVRRNDNLVGEKITEILDFIIDVLKTTGYISDNLPRRYETYQVDDESIALRKNKLFCFDAYCIDYRKNDSLTYKEIAIFLKDINAGWIDELIAMMQKDLRKAKRTIDAIEEVKEKELSKIEKYFTAMKMK